MNNTEKQGNTRTKQGQHINKCIKHGNTINQYETHTKYENIMKHTHTHSLTHTHTLKQIGARGEGGREDGVGMGGRREERGVREDG